MICVLGLGLDVVATPDFVGNALVKPILRGIKRR